MNNCLASAYFDIGDEIPMMVIENLGLQLMVVSQARDK